MSIDRTGNPDSDLGRFLILALPASLENLMHQESTKIRVRVFVYPVKGFTVDLDEILKKRIQVQDFVFSGIYYLLRGDQVIYVGSSTNIAARITEHIRQNKKSFDSFAIWAIPGKDLNELYEIEVAEIKKFSPESNVLDRKY